MEGISKIKIIQTVLVGIFLTSCLSTPFFAVTSPMASLSEDRQAKKFTPIPGKATIYIYRDEFLAVEERMEIIVDSKSIANAVLYSYVKLELSPGIHEVVSRTEKDAKLVIDIRDGQVYFIQLKCAPGLVKTRSRLNLVSEQIGKGEVEKCRLLRIVDPML